MSRQSNECACCWNLAAAHMYEAPALAAELEPTCGSTPETKIPLHVPTSALPYCMPTRGELSMPRKLLTVFEVRLCM